MAFLIIPALRKRRWSSVGSVRPSQNRPINLSCVVLCRKQVSATKAEAEKDGVKVPTTLAEYCIKTKVPSNDNSSDLLYDDLYDDDIDDEDEEEEDADCYDDDDSGNEES
jgi:hypothetical protein